MHTLNFNPACNTVDTNMEAAKAMRDMAMTATRLRELYDSGEIDHSEYVDRVAGLLTDRLIWFKAVDSGGNPAL